MDYVYVVTWGARGADKGEFFERLLSGPQLKSPPTAFEDQLAGEIAAHLCREDLGGRFAEVEEAGAADHIVGRWDSDEFTVWLERLIFEAAQ